MARPVAGWVLVGTGLVALVAGWFGVSGNALVAKQLPYVVSGGLAGIALVFLGGVVLGLHDLGRMARRVDAVEKQVDDLHRVLLEKAREFEAPENDGMVTVLTGSEVFHRPGCSVVNGKERLRTMSAVEAATAGLAPCKLCQA